MSKTQYTLGAEAVTQLRETIRRVNATGTLRLATNGNHRAITKADTTQYYNGYFMLRMVYNSDGEATGVEVYDGADPTGSYCGATDVLYDVSASSFDVPRTTLPLNGATDTNVFITLKWDAELNKYVESFSFSSSGVDASERLGHVRYNANTGKWNISQVWVQGVIHWRWSYIL